MKTTQKHILIVTSWYVTIDNQHPSVFIEEQIDILVKSGYKVTIIHPYLKGTFLSCLFKKKLSFSHTIGNSYEVYRIGVAPILPKWRRLNYAWLWLITNHLLNKHDFSKKLPDIIHSHVLFMGGYIACRLANKYQLPHVHSEHASIFLRDQNQLTFSDKQLLKTCFTKTNHVFFVSDFARTEMIKKYDLESIESSVVYNLVNPIFNNNLSDVNSEFSYIIIGEISEEKGFTLLLNAWKQLVHQIPTARLTVLGNGPKETHFFELAKKLGIDNSITWIPWQDRLETATLIAKHHVVISASKLETFGLTIAEGVVSGKPVVVTDSGGVKSIVNSQNGIITQQTAESFSKGLLEIYTNYSTYDQSAIRVEALKLFSPDKILLQFENVYQKWI